MTFHDPASIESGCVYTRGRDHETYKRKMYSKIIFWVTLLGLQTLCIAVPDDINNVTTISPQSTNDPFINSKPATLSTANEQTEAPVKFLETENATEAPGGSSVQLICRTESPVKECQWSLRLFNETVEEKKEQFSAFGEDNTDCSIKFKNVLPKHEGLWTCGARSDLNASFVQSNPIRFFVSEVEFVQLSRGIQIAAGESALLRCLVDKPVVQCEWSRRPINSSKEPKVFKEFVPNSDNEHDCSVRFKKVLYEDEGLWTCGVRLTRSGHLHEAPPAKLTLLPTGKISFVEIPENTSILVNTPETLKCLTNGKVDKCEWLWRPLTGDSEATVTREFPGTGNFGKNCSLNFTHVHIEDQGYWACRVTVMSSNTILTSPFIKLIVYDKDKVDFSELSQDIQISSGGSVSLRCVTSSSVDQCRWSLTPVNSNTTVVVKQFPAVGPEGRDCSVRLSHALAEQEGLWTCGAKLHGKDNYTNAPPAKLSLLEPEGNCMSTFMLEPHGKYLHASVIGWSQNLQSTQVFEPVAVALWTNTHQRVTLACRLKPVSLDARCQWIHESSDQIKRNGNLRKIRQELQMNYTTGMCTLQFKPTPSDLGSWVCKFTINTDDGILEVGSASVILLNTQTEDEWLSWAVGAATTLVLFLMILIVVLVVFKGRLFYRAELQMLETVPFQSQENNRHQNSQHHHDRVIKADTRLSEDVISTSNPNVYNVTQHYNSPRSRIYETFTTS